MQQQEVQTKAAEHATAVYDLAVRLSEVLAAGLADSLPMTGSPLNNPELDRQGLAGVFQYGLVFCAIDKCRLNRQAGAEYWDGVAQGLSFMAGRGARQSADKILTPLERMTTPEEMRDLTSGNYDPLAVFEGKTLAAIEKGPEHTPIGVLIKQIVTLFYSDSDHSAVADKVINISFEGIKVLFTDGGLI